MKMIRLVVCAVCLTLSVVSAWGQQAYYRSVQGLKQAGLKTALHRLIQPESVLKYGGKGEGYTWSGFAVADSLPGGYVLDRYSHEQRRLNGLNAVDGMNIEHIFANSWWGHTVNNAYCDLFNLFPSDGTANGRKSNNPIGVVNGTVQFDNGVIRVGKSDSYRSDSLITGWEPADNWKGDFARTYFYMATCYEHMAGEWQTTEGLLTVEPNSYPTLRPWVSELMLEWAAADPVDEIERQRNEAVYKIQGNRNPFVDYPSLADYIWGDSVDYVFYMNKQTEHPELFVPAEGEHIDFGLQALSRGFLARIPLRGRNLLGGLTVHTDNEEFVPACTSFSEEELTEGCELVIACRPQSGGRYQTVVTLQGERFEQTNLLSVEFVDGIPAYPATDLVCAPSSKRFTACWMDYEPGAEYTLEVYMKEASGQRVLLDGYPVSVTDTSYIVKNLKASTTYYYTVSLFDRAEGVLKAVSNEVRVDMPEVDPVFTVGVSQMQFATMPLVASTAHSLTVTLLEVPSYVTTVVANAPFEISADGTEWKRELVLTGAKPTFLIRMGAVPEEGLYESELVISTPGVPEIIVALIGQVDANKAFFESFENGSKGAYALGEVQCSAACWLMENALLGTDGNDGKNDAKSVRMKVVQNSSTKVYSTRLVMLDDKAGGCDSLWFCAGLYGNDTGAKLTVSYSADGGLSWIPVVKELTFVKGEWKRYGYKLNVPGPVRLKFEGTGSNGKRLNVDDVQMSDYKTADIVSQVAQSADDTVRVFTTDGILLRVTTRREALKGLPRGHYIVK